MVNYISVLLQGLLLLIAESLQKSQEFGEEGSPSLVWIQKKLRVVNLHKLFLPSMKYNFFFLGGGI